jgi:hypothetical protein
MRLAERFAKALRIAGQVEYKPPFAPGDGEKAVNEKRTLDDDVTTAVRSWSNDVERATKGASLREEANVRRVLERYSDAKRRITITLFVNWMNQEPIQRKAVPPAPELSVFAPGLDDWQIAKHMMRDCCDFVATPSHCVGAGNKATDRGTLFFGVANCGWVLVQSRALMLIEEGNLREDRGSHCFVPASFLSAFDPIWKRAFAIEAVEFALRVQEEAKRFGIEFDRELKSGIKFWARDKKNKKGNCDWPIFREP